MTMDTIHTGRLLKRLDRLRQRISNCENKTDMDGRMDRLRTRTCASANPRVSTLVVTGLKSAIATVER